MQSSGISSPATRNPSQPATPASPPSRKRFRLAGRSHVFDPRVDAARGDLADLRLADRLFAPHYAAPVARTVSSRTPLAGALGGEPISEVLPGERFDVLELSGDLAWGVAADGAVGFVRLDALGTFGTAGEQRRPSGEDVATAAEALLGTRYQMGGRSPEGVDSAGLVYFALSQSGREAPRFLDLMAEALGTEFAEGAQLERGDVLLWTDHAAIGIDEHTVVHVTEVVVREPLAALAGFGEPVARRRP